MKFSKMLCIIIACFMAMVFFCQEPMRAFAVSQSDANKYLADVKLLTDCTREEAVKWFKDNGYKLSEGDFAKEAFGDDAYLGYKTTTDKNDAITDMRIMNMNGGYEIIDFNERLENKYTEQFNSGAQKLMNAFREFKKNVDAHDKGTRVSPMAKAGQEMLNQFTYKETPLYDFLVSNSCTLTDYKRIIATLSTSSLSYIYFCLMLGLFDDSKTDFQTKLDENTIFAVKETDDYGAYDAAFCDEATELYSVVKQFADSYAIAKKNYEADKKLLQSQKNDGSTATADDLIEKLDSSADNGGIVIINNNDAEKSDLPELGEKNADNEVPAISQADSLEEVDAQKDDLDAAASHLLVLNAYDILSKYKITSDYADNLGDYLIKSATMENQTLGVRLLYPLVDMFTVSQLLALKSVGIETFAVYIDNNNQDMYNRFHDELTSVSDGTTCSITADVDTDMYDKTAAYTDATIRTEASGAKYVYESRNHDGYHKTQEMKMRKILSITVMVTGSLFVLGGIAIGLGGGVFFGAVTVAIYAAAIMISSGCVLASSIALIIGGVLIGIAILALVAIVVMAIIWLVHYFSDDDPEPQPRTEIPDIIYDSPRGSIIKYEALTNPLTGEPVDLTGGKGNEWDVLYYSYSTQYGSPIRIIDDKLFFEKTTNESVEQMMPLWRFGDRLLAADTKQYFGDAYSHLYCYYYTDDSLEGKDGGTTVTEGVYISGVKMAEGPYENTAKYALMAQGYTVLDYDLTPTDSSKYTYIGYSTTSNPSEALKDIRIGYNINTDKEQYFYGKSSYGCAGTTAYGNSIHTTSSEYAGTPILADAGIIAVNNRDDVPEGYEPVSLFCGGDAFDLRNRDERIGDWDEHIFLYYKPSVTYTSGPEYISGIALVTAKQYGNYSPDDYIEVCGFERIDPYYTDTDVNLMKYRTGANATSHYDGIYENIYTRLCISKTHNPYRAITDIQMLDYSTTATQALSSVSFAGNAYANCDVFCQAYGSTNDTRYIRKDKSYTMSGNATGDMSPYTYRINGQDTEDISCDKPFIRAIYVTCNTGDTPIGVDDIAFSLGGDTPEELVAQKPSLGSASEWQGVHEFGHPYNSEAKQLCHQIYVYYHVTGINETRYTNVDFHFYMYIRRSTPERPKYIASIRVCSYTGGDNWTNDFARIGAFASKYGELIEYNFAASASNQWKSTSGNKTIYKSINGNSSYIYVTYSEIETGSVRDIRLVPETEVDNPSEGSALYYQVWNSKTNQPAVSSLAKTDDGSMLLLFTCCGDKISFGGKNYYIYTTKNTFFGNAVTDFYYNGNTLDKNSKTVHWMDDTFLTDNEYYLHFKREEKPKDARYATMVAAVNGTSEQECLDKLYAYGCDSVLDYNFGTVGEYYSEYSYIGYRELTTQAYDYVITGLKIVSETANYSASELGNRTMEQYCAFSDENVTSEYACLCKDRSLGGVMETLPLVKGSSTLVDRAAYRYLYGTYNEELCYGVLMNTLTVTEGSDIAPDMAEISGYEKWIEGAANGDFSIKTRRSLTTVKALYNIYAKGASTYSKYIMVTHTLPLTGKEQYNIGGKDNTVCMWYQNTDTFSNLPYTGDVKSLFDTAYCNNTDISLYPAAVNGVLEDENYLLFRNGTISSSLTVPDGQTANIYTRGNTINFSAKNGFIVGNNSSLNLINETATKGKLCSDSADSLVAVNSGGNFTADKTVFDTNGGCAVRYSGNGMTLTDCDFKSSGGKTADGYIFANGGKKITLSNCTFASTTMGNSGTAVRLNGVDADITDCTLDGISSGLCGAIYAEDNTVNIKNITITNCKTTRSEGYGIIFAEKANITVTGGKLQNNSAYSYGGAVYADDSSIILNNVSMLKNSAAAGGAVWAKKSTVTLNGNSVNENSGWVTGAICAEDCTFTLNNCTLNKNCGINGGAMWLKNSSADMTGCNFSENSSGTGGAVYANNSIIRFYSSALSQNTASSNGGAVWANESVINLTDTSVTDNTAASGGGMYVSGTSSVLCLKNVTVTGNNATTYDNANKKYGVGGVQIASPPLSFSVNTAVTINNNTAGGNQSNLYLCDGALIDVGTYSLGGIIRVTLQAMQDGSANQVFLTNQLINANVFRIFKSDYSNWIISTVSKRVVAIKNGDIPVTQSDSNTSDNSGTNGTENTKQSTADDTSSNQSTLASVFGNGNTWIIIGVSVLFVGGLVFLYLRRKKLSAVFTENADKKGDE